MILVKSEKDIEKMRKAGEIAANALHTAGLAVKEGVSTLTLDKIIAEYIRENKAKASFLHYNGFPKSACISVNDEVIHGIPSRDRVLKEGDIVSIDVGAYHQGFHGDTAYTFVVGGFDKLAENAKNLLKATQKSLYLAVEEVRPNARIGDVSHAVESYCRGKGYGILARYCGHGVGKDLHEDPQVENVGKAGRGERLVKGMTIAIEPMITEEGDAAKTLKNGWTVVTANGTLSAHFEHTVAVTESGYEILTLPTIETVQPYILY